MLCVICMSTVDNYHKSLETCHKHECYLIPQLL